MNLIPSVTDKNVKPTYNQQELQEKFQRDWDSKPSIELQFGYNNLTPTLVSTVNSKCSKQIELEYKLGEGELKQILGKEELESVLGREEMVKLKQEVGERPLAEIVKKAGGEKKLKSKLGKKRVDKLEQEKGKKKVVEIVDKIGKKEIIKLEGKVGKKKVGNLIKNTGIEETQKKLKGTKTEEEMGRGKIIHIEKAKAAKELNAEYCSTTYVYKSLYSKYLTISEFEVACRYKGVALRGKIDSFTAEFGIPRNIVERKSSNSIYYPYMTQADTYGYIIYRMFGFLNFKVNIRSLRYETSKSFGRLPLRDAKGYINKALQFLTGELPPQAHPTLHSCRRCPVIQYCEEGLRLAEYQKSIGNRVFYGLLKQED